MIILWNTFISGQLLLTKLGHLFQKSRMCSPTKLLVLKSMVPEFETSYPSRKFIINSNLSAAYVTISGHPQEIIFEYSGSETRKCVSVTNNNVFGLDFFEE